MMRNLFIIGILMISPLLILSQEIITGTIVDAGTKEPLVGANVHWSGTTTGTTTDVEGKFSVRNHATSTALIISYVGYVTDTVALTGQSSIQVELNSSIQIEEVTIVGRNKSTMVSFVDPVKSEVVSEAELQKAACCNLSESFETNASVDVTFTDAVTGTRQIQMLGLAGPYSQITRENIPDVRGLSAITGLTYTPGTWIEKIILNKGTGSVLNGFESIAGQINVELRKPQTAERLFVNLYGNEMGRLEANAHLTHRFPETGLSTALLLHGSKHSVRHDRNDDGFLDHPLSDNLIIMNRWKYASPGGLNMQFGVKGMLYNTTGGQYDFRRDGHEPQNRHWGLVQDRSRLEAFFKMGMIYVDLPWKSWAIQVNAIDHRQEGFFGSRIYDADQQSGYFNFIYQSIIGNTNHKFRTGASLQYDHIDETLQEDQYDYSETVPGAYFEYTYVNREILSVVLGIRGDYHNSHGFFVTPRAHLRYAPSDAFVFRISGGRGLRTANVIAENIGLLASSRQIEILGEDPDLPYGLEPEIAWNFGLNMTHFFRLNQREGTISLDLYRTDFVNQIVVDLEQSPQRAVFYNLEGNSHSNSLQLQLDYELFPRLDVRLAYRWFDVKTTYGDELLQKPLLAAHRGFLNLAYKTDNGWHFDGTFNWQGDKRIPNTASNPATYQLARRSPDFLVINTQVTKNFGSGWSVYLGVENLLDYTQDNPILGSADPFGDNFDASLIWGPVFGRNVYVGMRWRIE